MASRPWAQPTNSHPPILSFFQIEALSLILGSYNKSITPKGTQAGALVFIWIPSHLMKKRSFLIHNLLSFVSYRHGAAWSYNEHMSHIFYYSGEKGRPYPQIQKAACSTWGSDQDKSVGTVRLDQPTVPHSCLVIAPYRSSFFTNKTLKRGRNIQFPVFNLYLVAKWVYSAANANARTMKREPVFFTYYLCFLFFFKGCLLFP